MRVAALTAFTVLAAGLWAVPHAVQAAEGDKPRVVEAWARATPGGVTVGAAYAEIHAPATKGDKLVRVTTPAAERAEIHTHVNDGGVMKMRRLEALELAPGSVVKLKPGGKHLMLFGLKAPLAVGGSLPLTLTFEKAGDIEISATIAPIGAKTPNASPTTGAGKGKGPKGADGSHSGSHSGHD